MNRAVLLSCAMLAMGGVSCTGNTSQQAGQAPRTPEALTTGSTASAAAAEASPRQPAVPQGARYTIFCASIQGPGHVERSKAMKDELARTTGMKDWHVIHRSDASMLYYGYYRTFNDPADQRETTRARNDHRRVNAIEDASGNRPFRQAIFVDLSAPDPTAPPEWDLARLRQHPNDDRHFWSVQIATYKDHPERKMAAVEAVRAAREQGIEAFYYHGPTMSHICVGVWPRSAVKEQQSQDEIFRATDQPILIGPSLPQAITGNLRDRENRPVRVVEERVEILDPTLQATLRKYPHSINGYEMVRRVGGRTIPDPSLLVPIPFDPATMMAADPRQGAAPREATLSTTPDAPPGAGRLRSLGN
jgi:hypothetical protein